MTQANGVVTTYTYDQDNRLLTLTTAKGSDTFLSVTYTLNGDGTRKTEADSGSDSGDPFSYSTTYTYDALDRLTEENRSGVYDDLYTYDLAGNRITETSGFTGGSTALTTNTYNAADQLVESVTTQDGEAVDDITYTYNADGAQITSSDSIAGNQVISTYDDLGRLASIEHIAGGADTLTTYTHDDAGDVVYEQSTNQNNGHLIYTQQFLIDNNNPTGYSQALIETDYSRNATSPTATTTTVSGLAPIAQVNLSNVISYLEADGRGSTRMLTTQAGTFQGGSAYDYDAFGNPIGGGAGTTLQFQGQVWDQYGQLYYMRARNYDPTLGQFTTMDDPSYADSSNPITENPYIFTGDDPENMVDPTGNDFTGLLFSAAGEAAEVGEAAGLETGANAALGSLEGAIDVEQGAEAGLANSTFAASEASAAASYAVGYASGFASSALSFAG